MASPKTEAAVSRPQGIQGDMEHLLAGAAIKGAQAVAKVRLGMIALLIVIPRSAVFLTGEELPIDPARTVASSFFMLYALGMIWWTRRALRLAEEKVKGRAEAVVVYSLKGAIPSQAGTGSNLSQEAAG